MALKLTITDENYQAKGKDGEDKTQKRKVLVIPDAEFCFTDGTQRAILQYRIAQAVAQALGVATSGVNLTDLNAGLEKAVAAALA